MASVRKPTNAYPPLDGIAPRSTLIKVINRLYRLSDSRQAGTYQQTLDKLNLRYSVLSPEGRLELIADLIMSSSGRLKAAEKKALALLSKDLTCRYRDSGTLLGFTSDYLRLVLAGCEDSSGRGLPALVFAQARKRLPASSAAGLLAALWLAGALSSGCTRVDPQESFAADSKKESVPIIRQLLGDYEPGQQGTDRINLLNKISRELNESADTAPAAMQQPARVSAASPATYTVQSGDSIRKIAEAHGIDYRKMVKLNNISYDRTRDWFVLYPGQVLTLPETAVPAGAHPSPSSVKPHAIQGTYYLADIEGAEGSAAYLVSKGDSLWSIAKKFNVPLATIASVNNISDPDMIRYGMMIKIPSDAAAAPRTARPFMSMSSKEKIRFLETRTITAAHPYLDKLVEVAEEYNIDPRLYASLIWEESWFDNNARSPDNCRRLAQLDPRFHDVTDDIKENFRKSLRYLRHEFVYYRRNGFDSRSATICALAAYNGGNTRIRRYIRSGQWDGRNIETIPLKETRDHLKKILARCAANYQARL